MLDRKKNYIHTRASITLYVFFFFKPPKTSYIPLHKTQMVKRKKKLHPHICINDFIYITNKKQNSNGPPIICTM